MRIGGIELDEGSVIKNISIPTGSVFPDMPNDGELFHHDGQEDPFIAEGNYGYTSGEWHKLITMQDLIEFNDTQGASINLISSTDQDILIKQLKISPEFILQNLGDGVYELQPNDLYFSSGTTSEISTSAINTPIFIPWNNVFIKDSIFTHSTTVNNSRITVGTGVLYNIAYNVTVQGSSNLDCTFSIFVNGVESSLGKSFMYITTGRWITTYAQTLMSLNEGDYIQIAITKTSQQTNPILTMPAGNTSIYMTRVRSQ